MARATVGGKANLKQRKAYQSKALAAKSAAGKRRAPAPKLGAGKRPFKAGSNPGILAVPGAIGRAARGITAPRFPDVGKAISGALEDKIIGNPGRRIKQVTGQK